MNYRKLGKSGLLVSEIALGTMIFGEDSERSASPEASKSMIHQFLDAGGNHIDTANVYAKGRSEEIVGEAIKGRRDQVVLATKVRFSMGKGINDQGLSRYHIMKSVEDSLRRLDTEHIDLLYMHCWDPLTPIEESLRAFDDLVRDGKVRYIGVSNFKAWQLMKSLGLSDSNSRARFISAQYQYSLINRDIESEFSDLCESEGVGITPWGPLGGGFLTGKYKKDQRPTDAQKEGRIAMMPDNTEESWLRRNIDRNWNILGLMEEIAAAHEGATISQIAIAWLLKQKAVSSVIIGVRTPEQLADNLAAAALELSDEEIAKLNKVSALEKGYPYRFMQMYGSRNLS